jgi:predicted dehydrogenase
MRLGLIGSTGHWQTYAPALARIPGLTLVAVAPAGPEETTGAFDHAPGLTVDTHRYDDAPKMLDAERLDLVQVCGRNDRIPVIARLCLDRGLPVMAEKPLAMDLPALEGLFQAARRTKAALVPMHTMRSSPELAAVQQAVRAGAIGDLLSVDILRSSEYPDYAGGPLPASVRQGSYPFRDLGVHGIYVL